MILEASSFKEKFASNHENPMKFGKFFLSKKNTLTVMGLRLYRSAAPGKAPAGYRPLAGLSGPIRA
jgi:hypothetical protein